MSKYEHEQPPKKKQRRMSDDQGESYDEDDDEAIDVKREINLENLDPEEIEAMIDEQAENQDVAFDGGVLDKTISQLGLRKKKNEELRAQFSEKPEKFQESEVDLDEIIRKFNSLSAYPELLQQFIDSPALAQLIELLLHENTDIAIDVINFFHEIITMEFEEAQLETILSLYKKTIKHKLLDAIVSNLQRLNEKQQDEYDASHKLLGIIESLLEVKPDYSKVLCDETPFLKWTLQRISPEFTLPARVIDDNKLYLSEILPIILTDEKNQKQFLKLRGIDSIIQILSTYEKRDPSCEEEKETLLNFIDCLCLLLVTKENQENFCAIGGISMMIQLIQAKNLSSKIALRVLSYALVNSEPNCIKFVDSQGLKYAFPILMKKGIKAKKADEVQKIEEQVTTILKNILKEGTVIQHDRVVNKFREDLIKVDRLFEMHQHYHNIMKQVEVKLTDPAYLRTLLEFEANNLEDFLYEKKLEEGLSILENVDFLISFLNNCKDELVSAKVKKNIKLHQIKPELLSILQQNIDHMDESGKVNFMEGKHYKYVFIMKYEERLSVDQQINECTLTEELMEIKNNSFLINIYIIFTFMY